MKQRAEKDSVMGRFNTLLYHTENQNNVTWGIQHLNLGHHVLAGPRSALVQILHSYFSKVADKSFEHYYMK